MSREDLIRRLAALGEECDQHGHGLAGVVLFGLAAALELGIEARMAEFTAADCRAILALPLPAEEVPS